jgi:hypothetical protein
MTAASVRRVWLSAVLVLIGCVAGSPVLAQTANSDAASAKSDETNIDTQLYLLIGTNQENDSPPLPGSLDRVVKELHATMPFRNYRLAATLVTRVKNEGRLSLKWIGGPLLAAAASSPAEPTFNDFRIDRVRLVEDEKGNAIVRMEGFSFGARIPLQVREAVASTGMPVSTTAYESTGLNTDISMRACDPIVVGTLNVGPSGDAIILVVLSRRASR